MSLAALEDNEHQIDTNFPGGVSLTGFFFLSLRYLYNFMNQTFSLYFIKYFISNIGLPGK